VNKENSVRSQRVRLFRNDQMEVNAKKSINPNSNRYISLSLLESFHKVVLGPENLLQPCLPATSPT
jgi:hypothetical protein